MEISMQMYGWNDGIVLLSDVVKLAMNHILSIWELESRMIGLNRIFLESLIHIFRNKSLYRSLGISF